MVTSPSTFNMSDCPLAEADFSTVRIGSKSGSFLRKVPVENDLIDSSDIWRPR